MFIVILYPLVTLSRSNNNNRNRAETAALEQISTTSTSTSTSSTANGVNDDSAGGSQVDASGRLRSIFPTTEDTRRRQYWSQSGDNNDIAKGEEAVSNVGAGDGAVVGVKGDRVGEDGGEGGDGITVNARDLEKPPVREEETQTITQTSTTIPLSTPTPPSSTPSLSTINTEVVPVSTPSKADMLNEFNWISPATLTEAERYEERIKQLESVPLPCIDAVTGMVHIVGEAFYLVLY